MKEGVPITVEPIGLGRMRVSCSAVPNYARVVTSVQELGLAVREAVGWALRQESDPEEQARTVSVPLDSLTCQACGKPWQRVRRNGRKPAFCDTCHPLHLPHIVRPPQEA